MGGGHVWSVWMMRRDGAGSSASRYMVTEGRGGLRLLEGEL